MKGPDTLQFTYSSELLDEMTTGQPSTRPGEESFCSPIDAIRLDTLERTDPKKRAITRLYIALRAYGERSFFPGKSFGKVVLDKEVEKMLMDVPLVVDLGSIGRRNVDLKKAGIVKMFLHNKEDEYLGCINCVFNADGYILNWEIVELYS